MSRDQVIACAVVGGAVALPMMLARLHLDGAHAGAANDAAAGELGRAGSLTFAVPSSYSMVDAWDAMKAALDAQGDDRQLAAGAHIADMWLAAYAAGAKADPVNYALAGADAVADSPAEFSLGSFTDPDICASGAASVVLPSTSPAWKPLGRAVCALRTGGIDLAGVLARSRAVAVAMDDADFRRDGDRRSDYTASPSILALPGRIVSAVAGAVADGVLGSPLTLAVLGVGAFVAWRALK